ncbi:MAG: hypothetical protein KGL63_00940 [Betaproteobacteria bacterium]|nr:hypothetical protein [Betaproteobacteria bacterium]
MRELEPFFEGLQEDEVMLFTTFALDEAILVALLENYGVPKQQKIVVFHDILRHRCPGLLRSFFPRSMVYTVVLTKSFDNRCPVFHSKVWARIKGEIAQKFVITSANLSQYHLVKREGSGTMETLQYLSGASIQCGTIGEVFSPERLYPTKEEVFKKNGLDRLKMKPHSLIVDTRIGVSMRVADTPLVEELKKLGVPEFCAAPFVCDGAIIKFFSPLKSFKVYEGEHRKKNLTLHAKVMAFPDCLVMGSVNWTAQAMGCMGKPVNHEVLLITRRDNSNSLINGIQGFTARKLGHDGTEVPADQDADEEINDWLTERLARINAPEQALLNISENRASITLTGKFRKASKVRLVNLNGEESISVQFRGITVREPIEKNEIHAFAKIIASGGVVLHGLKKNSEEVIWKVELNYQNYWPAFEAIRKLSRPVQRVGEGVVKKERNNIHFSDVRDIRQLVLGSKEKAKGFVTFNQWLVHHEVGSVSIPGWCLSLAELITKGLK